jgi:hypothetical protein
LSVPVRGRGPTIAETLTLDSSGLPQTWKVSGTLGFGAKVDEQFQRKGPAATWRDGSGSGKAEGAQKLYIAQNTSPYSLQLYARALIRAGGALSVLPSGEISLAKIGTLKLKDAKATEVEVTHYQITGLNLTPVDLLLDQKQRLIAVPAPVTPVIREGFESENERLRQLAAEWSSAFWSTTQSETAKRFSGPVRITNVRLFDPVAKALTEPVSVVVHRNRIASIQPTDRPVGPEAL